MPRIARKPLLVSLISLSTASVFVAVCWLSSGLYQDLHKIISSNLFLHFLFNSVIVVIVAKEHFGASRDELDKGFPLFHFAYMEEHGGKTGSDDEDSDCIDDLEGGADQINDGGHGNDDDGYEDDDDDYHHGSDGYDEDDDDNGSQLEMGWEDDEEEEDEYDSELERRVEAFIAKCHQWMEGRMVY